MKSDDSRGSEHRKQNCGKYFAWCGWKNSPLCFRDRRAWKEAAGPCVQKICCRTSKLEGLAVFELFRCCTTNQHWL